jgi:hypothetical protein
VQGERGVSSHGTSRVWCVPADTGGEFVAAYETDLSIIDPDSWVVPTNDLVGIFAVEGQVVNASAIDECHLIFYVGAQVGVGVDGGGGGLPRSKG